MKKETYVTDYLSKYTIKQLCMDEWNDGITGNSSRTHYRHKQRVKKVGRRNERTS